MWCKATIVLLFFIVHDKAPPASSFLLLLLQHGCSSNPLITKPVIWLPAVVSMSNETCRVKSRSFIIHEVIWLHRFWPWPTIIISKWRSASGCFWQCGCLRCRFVWTPLPTELTTNLYTTWICCGDDPIFLHGDWFCLSTVAGFTFLCFQWSSLFFQCSLCLFLVLKGLWLHPEFPSSFLVWVRRLSPVNSVGHRNVAL